MKGKNIFFILEMEVYIFCFFSFAQYSFKTIKCIFSICITLMQYINKIQNLILIIYKMILLVFVYCLNKHAYTKYNKYYHLYKYFTV